MTANALPSRLHPRPAPPRDTDSVAYMSDLLICISYDWNGFLSGVMVAPCGQVHYSSSFETNFHVGSCACVLINVDNRQKVN